MRFFRQPKLISSHTIQPSAKNSCGWLQKIDYRRWENSTYVLIAWAPNILSLNLKAVYVEPVSRNTTRCCIRPLLVVGIELIDSHFYPNHGQDNLKLCQTHVCHGRSLTGKAHRMNNLMSWGLGTRQSLLSRLTLVWECGVVSDSQILTAKSNYVLLPWERLIKAVDVVHTVQLLSEYNMKYLMKKEFKHQKLISSQQQTSYATFTF
jgi:hypothetical protein